MQCYLQTNLKKMIPRVGQKSTLTHCFLKRHFPWILLHRKLPLERKKQTVILKWALEANNPFQSTGTCPDVPKWALQTSGLCHDLAHGIELDLLKRDSFGYLKKADFKHC